MTLTEYHINIHSNTELNLNNYKYYGHILKFTFGYEICNSLNNMQKEY